MKWTVATLLLAATVVLTTGCAKKPRQAVKTAPNYGRPLPAGRMALRRITDPRESPDFTEACADVAHLRKAVRHSLSYLGKPSSRQFFPYGPITHADAVVGLEAFENLLDRGLPPSEMNRALREKFDVYVSVGCDDEGTVLFTGYYTPIFDASSVRTDRFAHPLYRQPADLVKAPDGTTLGRRLDDGRIVPYPDRRQLESTGMPAGGELFWLADAFEVYIAHVQGSAKLRLRDGRLVTVGYVASTGHDYVSIGREMIRDGKVPADELSLQRTIEYFDAHPNELRDYTWRNPRFVFFGRAEGDPLGCLNEPVTALRSIATDKSIFPRACLTLLATRLPRRLDDGRIEAAPYSGFALDQDAGGAIRAPGRCDVYMGIGPDAGQLAGRTRQEGKLYYLFLKK